MKEKGSGEIPEEKKEAIKKEPEPILKKEPVSPPPPPSLKKPEPLKPLVKAEGGSFNESHLTAVQLANLKVTMVRSPNFSFLLWFHNIRLQNHNICPLKRFQKYQWTF